jgi:DNA-nicking Smr family endonuclease
MDEEPVVTGGTPERVSSQELLEFRRNGISDRVFRRLRSGRLAVEAELDLHGLTANTARNELKRFIDRCQQHRFACVRVIHGRGLSSGSRGPVLKAEVNHQLRRWEGVLAFSSAPPQDGGSGALYVLLKRR